MAEVAKTKALMLLRELVNAIPALRQEPAMGDSQSFRKWLNDTETTIREIFGEMRTPQIRNLQWHLASDQNEFASNLGYAQAELESMITEVENFWPEDTGSSEVRVRGLSTGNEIFVIHGRDETTKNAVAGFLRELGLKPILLADQPNQGLTVIEKFEKHSEVGWAIALLTPDDVGSLQHGEHLRARARQNVIFELGYFVGRFGRHSVCALTKGVVEIPSDYSGVLYIPIDEPDDWQAPLIKELKSFGFHVQG